MAAWLGAGRSGGLILGAGLVAHHVGDLGEEWDHDGGGGVGDVGFAHRLAHQLEPAIAFGDADGEREVSGAEARVTSFLEVGWRAAEPIEEEVAQSFF